MNTNKRNNDNGHQNNSYYKRNRPNNINNEELAPDELGFYIKPFSFYDRSFPFMKKPVEIGSFVSNKRQENIKIKNLIIDESVPNYGAKYLSNLI
jgi:hypothetical protein